METTPNNNSETPAQIKPFKSTLLGNLFLRPYGNTNLTPNAAIAISFAWIVIFLMASLEGTVWASISEYLVPDAANSWKFVVKIIAFLFIFSLIEIVCTSLVLFQRKQNKQSSFWLGITFRSVIILLSLTITAPFLNLVIRDNDIQQERKNEVFEKNKEDGLEQLERLNEQYKLNVNVDISNQREKIYNALKEIKYDAEALDIAAFENKYPKQLPKDTLKNRKNLLKRLQKDEERLGITWLESAETLAQAILSLLFFSLLAVKLFEPDEVKLYLNEDFQNAYKRYMAGEFDNNHFYNFPQSPRLSYRKFVEQYENNEKIQSDFKVKEEEARHELMLAKLKAECELAQQEPEINLKRKEIELESMKERLRNEAELHFKEREQEVEKKRIELDAKILADIKLQEYDLKAAKQRLEQEWLNAKEQFEIERKKLAIAADNVRQVQENEWAERNFDLEARKAEILKAEQIQVENDHISHKEFMSNIFFCYPRKNQKQVIPIIDALKKAGWAVFYDDAVLPGNLWMEHIHAELMKAQCLVVIVSEAMKDSHWMAEEINIFKGIEKNRGRLKDHHILPIYIDEIVNKDDSCLFGITTYQSINFFNWDGNIDSKLWQNLIRSLSQWVKIKTDVGHEQAEKENKLSEKNQKVNNMADIFFSYSRKDTDIVLPIIDSLIKEGFSVFFDEHVSSGRNWTKILEKELDKAKVLLVAVSENSNTSTWVDAEIMYFLGRNPKDFIIPIRIENITLPFLLSNSQYVSLINWNRIENSDWKNLINTLNNIKIFPNKNSLSSENINAGKKQSQ